MFIGSTNQLPPMVFGDNLENPFQTQLVLSPLPRWSVTGCSMYELDYTSRFANQPLLELCALVNQMTQLQAVESSFDADLSAKYAAVNEAIWGTDSNLIFINVEGAEPVKGVTNSTYCLATACAVMKNAVDRIAHIKGTWAALM